MVDHPNPVDGAGESLRTGRGSHIAGTVGIASIYHYKKRKGCFDSIWLPQFPLTTLMYWIENCVQLMFMTPDPQCLDLRSEGTLFIHQLDIRTCTAPLTCPHC